MYGCPPAFEQLQGKKGVNLQRSSVLSPNSIDGTSGIAAQGILQETAAFPLTDSSH